MSNLFSLHHKTHRILEGYRVSIVGDSHDVNIQNGECKEHFYDPFDDFELFCTYVNGKKEGEGRMMKRTSDGYVCTMKGVFVDGELNGHVQLFYESSGNVKKEGNAKNGMWNGIIKEYDEDCTVVLEGEYVNGIIQQSEQSEKKEMQQNETMNSDFVIDFEDRPISSSKQNEQAMIEITSKRIVVYRGEYDESTFDRHGVGIEYDEKNGKVMRECEYERGVMKRVLKEFWNETMMIEYDENGKEVYVGECVGEYWSGYARDGMGREYDDGDKKKKSHRVIHENGVKKYDIDELIEVYVREIAARKEREIRANIGMSSTHSMKQYYEVSSRIVRVVDDGCSDLSELRLMGFIDIQELIIGDFCFKSTKLMRIEGLSELRRISVGFQSFTICSFVQAHDDDPYNQGGRIMCENRSLTISKCESLEVIEIGRRSFADFIQLNLSELNKLTSFTIKGDKSEDGKRDCSFYWVKSFEMRDLPSLQTLSILGGLAFNRTTSFSLMNLPSLTSLILDGYGVFCQAAQIVMIKLPRLNHIRFAGDGCLGAFGPSPEEMILEDIPCARSVEFGNEEKILNSFKQIKRGVNVSEEMIQSITNHIRSKGKHQDTFKVIPL